jgi:GAG-pre-integrase domain
MFCICIIFFKYLLSISKLITDNLIYIEFHDTSYFVKNKISHQVLLIGTKHSGLYLLASSPQALLCHNNSSQLWHQRLGHASESSIQPITNKLSSAFNKLDTYEACCLAKSHRFSFTLSSTMTHKPLEVVHCDVWGPSPVISNTSFIYYVLFIDYFSRFNWMYFVLKRVKRLIFSLNSKVWLKIYSLTQLKHYSWMKELSLCQS